MKGNKKMEHKDSDEEAQSERELREENSIFGIHSASKRAIEAQSTKSRTYKKQDQSDLTPKAFNELAEKVMRDSEMKFQCLKIESEAENLK